MHPKWSRYFEKHKAFQEYYDKKLKDEGCRIDTIYRTDSIIISYFSLETEKLLKKQHIFIENNCEKFEFIDFYNKKGLLVYRIQYQYACPRKEEHFIIPYYERYEYEYDRKGRLKIHVFQVSTPMTIKNIYGYKKGKQYIKEHAIIPETDFWE